ncbi:MAG: arginine--tRNA ligase [Erysipelotrichales bacterium]|nr:arginine--tRNA ligase [Erysipelotrichales bacterium]
MSLIKETENYLTKVINSLGYQVDSVKLEKSKMPEYGQYQINVAMQFAKRYGKNPRDIAEDIVASFDSRFINVNIQGPGFINVTFDNEVLTNYLNKCIDDFSNFVDKSENKRKIVLDYGGANIAKELHVGHLRCNIGEAIRRLIKVFGDESIGDVHWGDWGTPIGLVIREIQELYPDLPYFDESYTGEYPSVSPVTNDDLGVIYPRASLRKKEDEKYAEEAREMTLKFQKGVPGIRALWQHIVNVSKTDCQAVYDYLNCHFDYSYGESDADPFSKPVIDFLNKQGATEMSNGILIMHVANEDDKKEMPPLLLKKSDGAVLYDTTDLATIMQRMQDFTPDAIWYFADERQSLHFEQIFRGSYKSGLVPETVELKFNGFGTINGPDGKPFKTRDGGVMSLKGLIKLVYDKIEPKIKEDITGEERAVIANKLTVATLKYADLLPSRKTDYIFDIDKFTSFEGKTGIYAVYTATRMKSLLNKVGSNNVSIKSVPNQDVLDILVKLTELTKVLNASYSEVSTSYICEFIYELCSLYNKFYANNNIANEENADTKETFIAVTKLAYNTLSNLLDILGIEIVDKM